MAVYYGTTGADSISGSSGNDEFRYSGGSDTIVGGAGEDVFRAPGAAADYTTQFFSDGSATLVPTAGGDTIRLIGIEKIEFNQEKFNLAFNDPADAKIGGAGPGWVKDRTLPETWEIDAGKLKVNVNEALGSPTFYHYQGMKYLADAADGNSSWNAGSGSKLSYEFSIPVDNEFGQRTGVWLVMENNVGGISRYPILEYVDADSNLGGAPATGQSDGTEAIAGFRAYKADGTWQWIGMPAGVDSDGDGHVTVEYRFKAGVSHSWWIDGVMVFEDTSAATDGSAEIRTFIVNSSNRGEDQTYTYDNFVLTNGAGETVNVPPPVPSGGGTPGGGTGGGSTAATPGPDIVSGSTGPDTIDGGLGDDTIGGGAGDDTVTGGDGNDVAFGGEGSDFVGGGAGDDKAYGGAGNDTVAGGAGNDVVGGGAGNDQLLGGAGNDTVYGGSGDDTVFAGSGADRIYGGTGNDVIYFGTNDGAADVYASVASNGSDTLWGFEDGIDKLNLTASGIASFSDLSGKIADDGAGNVTIDLGGGNILTLRGVTASQLSAADFEF